MLLLRRLRPGNRTAPRPRCAHQRCFSVAAPAPTELLGTLRERQLVKDCTDAAALDVLVHSNGDGTAPVRAYLGFDPTARRWALHTRCHSFTCAHRSACAAYTWATLLGCGCCCAFTTQVFQQLRWSAAQPLLWATRAAARANVRLYPRKPSTKMPAIYTRCWNVRFFVPAYIDCRTSIFHNSSSPVCGVMPGLLSAAQPASTAGASTLPLVLNNSAWLAELKVTDLLTGAGRHLRMGAMLSKDNVRTRLAESGTAASPCPASCPRGTTNLTVPDAQGRGYLSRSSRTRCCRATTGFIWPRTTTVACRSEAPISGATWSTAHSSCEKHSQTRRKAPHRLPPQGSRIRQRQGLWWG
eukprot:COSAG05_NODE_5512_length_1155_cov_2.181818_2_plen_355_part_00